VEGISPGQSSPLKGFLDGEGIALSQIRPHGALYGMASQTESVAHAIGDAAQVLQAHRGIESQLS
jgi:5-oxoprolinase (ATP-hydrolysing) subunit A